MFRTLLEGMEDVIKLKLKNELVKFKFLLLLRLLYKNKVLVRGYSKTFSNEFYIKTINNYPLKW